jgi:hypothetical protein
MLKPIYLLENGVRAFPKNLAKVTIERWDNLVGGDYKTPPRPPDRLTIELFEIIYLAAAMPEEARYPKFNIVAVPASDSESKSLGEVWSFDCPRSLTVDELRRLAPAVDSKKSAILLCWSEQGWQIAGLVDLGTSWNRARTGLQYHYHFAPYLFVQVERPGRMRVYQGRYIVAALRDGRLEQHKGFEISFVLGRSTHDGMSKLWNKISYPKIEEPREFEEFQFMALWNTFAALANCISDDAHGGAIVIVPNKNSIAKELRIKYPQSSAVLQKAFIDFMNARHEIADVVVRLERDENRWRGHMRSLS